MSEICLQCGGPQTGAAAICPYCGQAATASAHPAIAVAAAPQQGTETLATASTLVMTAIPVGSAQPEPTLAMSAPTMVPPEWQPVATGLRRPRRRTVVALGSAVVLVIGGSIAYELLRPQPPSAAGTVRAYFADLASGDTTAAMKLVDPSTASSPSGTSVSLLTAAALSSPTSRPSGLTVDSSTQEPDIYGRSVTLVKVSYKLGSSTVDQDMEVGANVTDRSGVKQPYLLESPFLTLQIQDGSGRPLTVNGVQAGSQNLEAPVFPGVYTVAMQGDQLIAGVSQVAAYAPMGGGGTLSADFSAPALAPGAEAAVQAQIKSALDTCAQSTSTSPPNCPFSIFQSGSDDSVKWSIQTYPTPTVKVYSGAGQGQEVEFVDDQQDGVAQYADQYTDWSGTSQTTSGTQDFGVSGYASVSGSTIQITFDAYAF